MQNEDQTKYVKYNSWQSKGIQTSSPHQNPIYYSWISLTNFVFYNYEEFIFAYVESRRAEDYLKTEMELKLFKWKRDSWSLFENWSLGNQI